MLTGGIGHAPERLSHAQQAVFADVFGGFSLVEQFLALVFQALKAAGHSLDADFRTDGFLTSGGEPADLSAGWEDIAQADTQPIHRLTGIQISAGAKTGLRPCPVTIQQIGRTAGNMKDQDRAVKQFAARRGKKRGGDMAFLMRELYEWDPPCQRESCGGIHPGKETGHIGFFHRTRPGRDPDGLHGSQIGLLGKFLQHLRQSSGVMKHGVALAKPKLSRTYR